MFSRVISVGVTPVAQIRYAGGAPDDTAFGRTCRTASSVNDLHDEFAVMIMNHGSQRFVFIDKGIVIDSHHVGVGMLFGQEHSCTRL